MNQVERQWTRYVTVILAIIQALVITVGLNFILQMFCLDFFVYSMVGLVAERVWLCIWASS